MKIEFAQLLVNSIRQAMRRNRWILSALVIASLALLAACWNVYFSWLRTIALKTQWGPEKVGQAQKWLVSSWVDSGFLSVPLLGIKLHIADASFLGALAITILTLWLFYSMRRENHLIGKSLMLARNEPRDIKDYIYYGITSHHVFSTVSESDDPIRSLEYSATEAKVFGVRSAFRLLYYLPALTIFFIILCDILSIVWLKSAFRAELVTEGDTTCLVFARVGASALDATDWIRIGFMEGVALVMAVCTSFFGYYCRQYQAADLQVLRKFSDTIYESQSLSGPTQEPEKT